MWIIHFFVYQIIIFLLRDLSVHTECLNSSIVAEAMNENENSINNKIQFALKKHKNGEFQDAIIAYEEILSSSIDDSIDIIDSIKSIYSTLHVNVATLYMQFGDNENSKNHFEKAIEFNSTNSQAYYNMAILLTSKLNEHRKALSHAMKCNRIEGNNNPKTFHLIGNILQSMNRNDEAEIYFINAEKLALQQKKDNLITLHDQNTHSITELIPLLKLKAGEELIMQHDSISYSIQCISSQPMIFQIKDLLSHSECEYIINKARPSMEKSYVMGGSSIEISSDWDSTSSNVNAYRSSQNTWLSMDEILINIQRKLSSLLSISFNYIQQNSEDLQVVKYSISEEFKLHHDSSTFHPRLMTILLYLTNPIHEEAGGETWFPLSNISNLDSNIHSITDAIQYCNNNSNTNNISNLKIKPRQGHGLVFFNYLLPNMTELDISAIHAGMPVLQGEKWIANYWIRHNMNSLMKSYQY